MPSPRWCSPRPSASSAASSTPADLASPDVRAVAAGMTVACATDGNHGRSVAWGARTAGCRAVIFIHAGVSQSRADAMAAFGAEIRRIAGSYDDSVRIAAETAAREGWTVVSDTSWEGYEAIPLTRHAGLYRDDRRGARRACPSRRRTSSCRRASAASPRPLPPMPASGSGRMRRRSSSSSRSAPPACSPAPGPASRVTIPHGEPTVMAMLECATPSPIAFEMLPSLADGYVTLREDEATDMMKRLADPLGGDTADRCRRKRRHRAGRLPRLPAAIHRRVRISGSGRNRAYWYSTAKARPIRQSTPASSAAHRKRFLGQ